MSTPIRWDEVDDAEPGDFTIATVPARFAELGDLHAGHRRRRVPARRAAGVGRPGRPRRRRSARSEEPQDLDASSAPESSMLRERHVRAEYRANGPSRRWTRTEVAAAAQAGELGGQVRELVVGVEAAGVGQHPDPGVRPSCACGPTAARGRVERHAVGGDPDDGEPARAAPAPPAPAAARRPRPARRRSARRPARWPVATMFVMPSPSPASSPCSAGAAAAGVNPARAAPARSGCPAARSGARWPR